ncbi:hypothetical protein EYF80_050647 [Liparis tanakae]|uniref:Uncharacterized protein n=1 Tax=Liparis tanakae TaxID=230148 RepID=A0A4Z2FFK1_9TELE|nr:hypothetical protein EYF80_050647 [Liparis tanakae]
MLTSCTLVIRRNSCSHDTHRNYRGNTVLRAFPQLLVLVGVGEHVDPDAVLGVQPADHELGALILQGGNLEDAGGGEQGLDVGLGERDPGRVGVVQDQVHGLGFHPHDPDLRLAALRKAAVRADCREDVPVAGEGHAVVHLHHDVGELRFVVQDFELLEDGAGVDRVYPVEVGAWRRPILYL